MSMQKYGLLLTKETYARVPALLEAHGVRVETRPNFEGFEMLACRRDGVTVVLSKSQPTAWSAATDGRQDVVVVAALGESVFRFWRLGRENRLRRDVIEVLRPHAWQPGTADRECT